MVRRKTKILVKHDLTWCFGYMILHKLINLLETQFPRLYNGESTACLPRYNAGDTVGAQSTYSFMQRPLSTYYAPNITLSSGEYE